MVMVLSATFTKGLQHPLCKYQGSWLERDGFLAVLAKRPQVKKRKKKNPKTGRNMSVIDRLMSPILEHGDTALNPSSGFYPFTSVCVSLTVDFRNSCKHGLLFVYYIHLMYYTSTKFSIRKTEIPGFIYYKRVYQIMRCKCCMLLILWEHQ